MKRCIAVTVGGLSIFLLGIGFGCLLNYPRRSPSPGLMPPSPDGRYTASAFPWTEARGFGRSHDRTYSEFVIETPPPDLKVFRRVVIEDSAQVPPIDWYNGEGQVVWA